jgi:hypothetical protein
MPMVDLGAGNVVNQPVNYGGGLGGMTGQQAGVNMINQTVGLGKSMNPFDSARPQFMQQMQQLQSNPSSITSTPGYAAGLEGVQRTMAAQGYQGSGNMMSALQNYSGDFYMKQMQMLSGLAGANAAPGAGAGVQQWGLEQGTNLIGQGQASDTYTQMMQQMMQGGIGGPQQSIADLAMNQPQASPQPTSIYQDWQNQGSPQPSGWDSYGGPATSDGMGFGGVGAY